MTNNANDAPCEHRNNTIDVCADRKWCQDCGALFVGDLWLHSARERRANRERIATALERERSGT